MRAALVQISASDDPSANLPETEARIREAAEGGADLILTPEVTNCVSASRSRQREVLRPEPQDETLARIRELAAELATPVLIGSLALKLDDDDRFANRSFLIGRDGAILARYDKIHMFDVDLGDGESYAESSGFRPGDTAVTATLDGTTIGLSICYDLRFPHLYTALARAGASVIAIPSAFTIPTGEAHWEVLLRARAIETGAFILAPAQTGTHRATRGRERRTYGHSLAVAPWGQVIANGGDAPGVTFADLDLSEVDAARARIPALANARAFRAPE